MTKTAEERAREIAARIRENADDPDYDPVFDVLTELRQTERAVWLSAAGCAIVPVEPTEETQ